MTREGLCRGVLGGWMHRRWQKVLEEIWYIRTRPGATDAYAGLRKSIRSGKAAEDFGEKLRIFLDCDSTKNPAWKQCDLLPIPLTRAVFV